MSREALIILSLRSWCSSNSDRNASNIGKYGDCCRSLESAEPSYERLTPAMWMMSTFVELLGLVA